MGMSSTGPGAIHISYSALTFDLFPSFAFELDTFKRRGLQFVITPLLSFVENSKPKTEIIYIFCPLKIFLL